MPRTYVDLARMREIGTECKTVAKNVDDVHDKLLRVVRQLDWDVRQQENVEAEAKRIGATLESYTIALKSYKTFIDSAYKQYKAIEKEKCNVTLFDDKPTWSGFFEKLANDFDWALLAKGSVATSFLYLLYNGFQNGFSQKDIITGGKKLKEIYEAYTRYQKIGRAVGKTTANTWWLKKMFGLNSPGHLSTAKDVKTRWRNNLFNNKTSPYNLRNNVKDAISFSDYTGANGVGKAVCSWAGILFSGVTNYFSNREEQKKSNGTMSDERVIIETVTETVVDTVVMGVAKGAMTALVGTAIATTAPFAAAPVVVAAVTEVAFWGIDAAVEYFTGQGITEWVSDGLITIGENVGNAVKTVGKSVAGWFKRSVFSLGG